MQIFARLSKTLSDVTGVEDTEYALESMLLLTSNTGLTAEYWDSHRNSS